MNLRNQIRPSERAVREREAQQKLEEQLENKTFRDESTFEELYAKRIDALHRRNQRRPIERAAQLFLADPQIWARLQSHIRGDVTNTDNCWVWTGARSGATPKAVVGFSGSSVIAVLGLLYRAFAQRPVDRVDRRCGTAQCVNPWHAPIKSRVHRSRTR